MRITLTFLLVLFFSLAYAQEGSFEYSKFKGTEGLLLSSDAKEVKGGKVHLTPAQKNKRGGLWYSADKMFVSDTFEASFCFKIHKHGGEGPSGEGGEGLAFVIHNNEIPGKNGRKYEGMGYSGIANSVAIEFDTQDTEDMGRQHVSVQTNGVLANSYKKASSHASMTLDDYNIKDGKEHTATIHYNNPFLTISLDGFQVLQCKIDLLETLNLDEGRAWVGITAATGKTYSIHEINCFSMASQEKHIPYEVKAGGRELKRTKRIVVHSKDIRIRLWDINQEDGDIVSVNLNGEWVIDNYVLTNEGEYFNFKLDGQVNYLVLHAHNLGKIPPNTAGISVSDGVGGETEYTLRSNLYLSDSLLIEYHQKEDDGEDKDLEVTRKSGKGKADIKVEPK
ncbi:MAG: hypothetical protein ACI94Y_003810 [Maribacter sp.]|jgi:hypothetical protein